MFKLKHLPLASPITQPLLYTVSTDNRPLLYTVSTNNSVVTLYRIDTL
jgi:hypothetical protein